MHIYLKYILELILPLLGTAFLRYHCQMFFELNPIIFDLWFMELIISFDRTWKVLIIDLWRAREGQKRLSFVLIERRLHSRRWA